MDAQNIFLDCNSLPKVCNISRINFKVSPFILTMSDFKPTKSDDRYFSELLPVLIGIGPNGELLAYGTCFIAMPHLAVTAKHVFEEILAKDPGLAIGGAKFEYWIVQVVWDEITGHDYVVWTIDSAAYSPHSDIAVIWLRSWNDSAERYKAWKVVPITFELPAISSAITAFGIHDVKFDGSRVGIDGKFEHIEFKSERSISTGIVKAHFPNGRDQVLLPFPCFEVDAKFESGMSGGIVINDKSQVCGIVCSSLHATNEDEEHVSYVTLLWPIMAIPVRAGLLVEGGGTEYQGHRIKDLAIQGKFSPVGWQKVLIDDQLSKGGALTIQYI